MDLFLVPDNPLRTVLVSANGVAHYQITTTKVHDHRKISRIQRPAESEADSVVAEIEWRNWDNPTIVRSSNLRGLGGSGVLATDFLHRRGPFSSSRYFLGDDHAEYRWKTVKGVGCVLTRVGTNEEVARYTCMSTSEGLYAGERKSRLRIQPGCTLDFDLLVITFVIMEKKRRDHAGDGTVLAAHDEDPQGDGGGDGGSGGC